MTILGHIVATGTITLFAGFFGALLTAGPTMERNRAVDASLVATGIAIVILLGCAYAAAWGVH